MKRLNVMFGNLEERRRRRMLRCYAEINGLRIELIRGKTLLKGQERRNNT
jgi:hypothetical protein